VKAKHGAENRKKKHIYQVEDSEFEGKRRESGREDK